MRDWAVITGVCLCQGHCAQLSLVSATARGTVPSYHWCLPLPGALCPAITGVCPSSARGTVPSYHWCLSILSQGHCAQLSLVSVHPLPGALCPAITGVCHCQGHCAQLSLVSATARGTVPS
ncbi:hypothetical protein ACOMHN_037185 [Nucella lapillus]